MIVIKPSEQSSWQMLRQTHYTLLKAHWKSGNGCPRVTPYGCCLPTLTVRGVTSSAPAQCAVDFTLLEKSCTDRIASMHFLMNFFNCFDDLLDVLFPWDTYMQNSSHRYRYDEKNYAAQSTAVAIELCRDPVHAEIYKPCLQLRCYQNKVFL